MIGIDGWQKKIAGIKTQVKRDQFCRDHGITHYSVLLDLEYFDATRFFTIDPIHDSFLGTAKKQCLRCGVADCRAKV